MKWQRDNSFYVYKVAEKRKEFPNDKFIQNLEKWVDFVSYMRFFPDAFYQMMEKEDTQIRLSSDQKMILRICSRFPHSYLVFPRGFGKTMLNIMSMYHACILHPNLTYSLTAQTRESSASLIMSKIREIEDSYKMLKNEIKEYRSQKEDTEIHFVSGGIISNLANHRSSLGQRRHKLMVEEYAQVDDNLLAEVIYPIVDIPRRTIGKLSVMSPYENNGGMTYITTSYFVNTPPFYKGLDMMEKMINLQGCMNVGASYEVALAYGRGAPRSVIMQKKEESKPLNFKQNYESVWVGVTNNALVDISKVMNLRTLTRAELSGKKHGEYVIAVDVARSEDDSNNRCCATVVKIIRTKVGKINKLQLVNIVDISATKNFRQQAIDVMRLREKYNAKRVVIDANGLGVGLVDELMQEQVDPVTGEGLGCWDTMNTDQIPEDPNAPDYIYALKSQSINHDIIVNFINMVEGEKLQLLEKRTNNNYDVSDVEHIKNEVMPFVQTDLLLEELANLKLKDLGSGKMTVIRNTKSVDKDKFSSLSYNIWYIFEHEDNYIKAQEGDMSDFLLIN